MSTYIVKSLAQAKLLSDPFKLKLLEQFAGVPVTTKQVADALGEKAPRLYRHVDAMVEAGFLELIEERPKRGTTERYYKAVANRFEVDPDLFTPASTTSGEAFQIVRDLLRETEHDFQRIAGMAPEMLPKDAEPPIFMKLSISASRAQIADLQDKLGQWIAEVEALAEAPGPADRQDLHYAGLLAFYPVPEAPSETIDVGEELLVVMADNDE